MAFIKLTHTGGSVYLNLDNIYSMEETSTTDLTITDNTATSIAYTFASSDELAEVVSKLESILRVIDIDKLAIQ